MAGLTSTGFEAKTLETIKSEIEADERALISPTINTATASVVGQLNGVFASKLRETWELAQAVYNAMFGDSASGYALTLRAGITGTEREAATPSTVVATVNVDPGTYAAGSLIASVEDDPTARFFNAEDVVNSGGAAANVDATFECETTGATRANSGTLTVIAQAVSGWNSITNTEDASLGAEEESDAALRIRREDELRAAGSTTAQAIRADLLQVALVETVTILENDTNSTDVNGVPGHTVECIVFGPQSPTDAQNDAVAEQVFASKAAGIGTYGNTSRTVTDDQGTEHTVMFTRPTLVDVYVEIELEVDADTYAGDTAVQEAIADAAASLSPGEVVRARVLASAALDVAGVTDIVTFGMSTAPGGPFLDANVAPTVRQIVDIDTANVAVTVA